MSQQQGITLEGILALLQQQGAGVPAPVAIAAASGTCPGYDGVACGKPSDPRSKKKGYCGEHFTASASGYIVAQWRRLDETARTVALSRMQAEAAGTATPPVKGKGKGTPAKQAAEGVTADQVTPAAFLEALSGQPDALKVLQALMQPGSK